MTKEHGLLFCGDMIAALLVHRKTMTRRSTRGLADINQNPDAWELLDNQDRGRMFIFKRRGLLPNHPCHLLSVKSPYAVGDTIYVKGTWATVKAYDSFKPSELPRNAPIFYKAENPQWDNLGRWRSAMFMPKWAARIRRTIAAIGCERVQDITDEDAMAEGVGVGVPDDYVWIKGRAKQKFRTLWDMLNGKKNPWEKNVWVWKLTIPEVTP